MSCRARPDPPALLHYEAVREGMGVDEFAKVFPHELDCDFDLSGLKDARAVVRGGGGRDLDGDLVFLGLYERRAAFRFVRGRLASKTKIDDKPGSAFFRAAPKGISLAEAVALAPAKLRMVVARDGQNPGVVKLPSEARKLYGFAGRAFCVVTYNGGFHALEFTIKNRKVLAKQKSTTRM